MPDVASCQIPLLQTKEDREFEDVLAKPYDMEGLAVALARQRPS